MDYYEYKLNGLDDQKLPDILPNTANEIIHVNASETGYELIPTENIISEPTTSKQILNSLSSSVWDWTNDPKAVSITVDGGVANGFKFDGTTSSIITELNTVKIVNQGVERVLCSGSGVDLKGAVSVDNQIICVSNGIGTTSTNRIEYGATNISLRANGTIRVQATGTGVTLVGSISQLSGANTNQFYGNHSFSSGTMSIDGNTTFTGVSNVTAVNGTISATTGQVNGYNIKGTNGGTSALCSVRVNEDNCGLYQSATGNLDISANSQQCLNFTSTRTQTQNTFNFNRCYALQNTVYNVANAYTVFGSSNPLYILVRPATGNLDLDFQTATNYFSGQEFTIITRDPTGSTGASRLRFQSDCFHLTGTGAVAGSLS